MSSYATIVHPNTCSVCEYKGVPMSKRSIISDPDAQREYCGHCGADIFVMRRFDFKTMSKVACSLIRHGLFSIDTSTMAQNAMALTRFDEAAGVHVTCRMGVALYGDNPKRALTWTPYDRSKVACAIPDCVRLAIDLIASMSLCKDGLVYRPSFDMADVRRDAKSIRFSWMVPNTCSESTYEFERVQIEFAWTDSSPVTTVIPTPDELSQRPKHSASADEELKVRSSAATLLAEAVDALRKQGDGACVNLWWDPTGKPYHPAAIEQVIAQLDERGWNAVAFKGGHVVHSYYLQITRKQSTCVG